MKKDWAQTEAEKILNKPFFTKEKQKSVIARALRKAYREGSFGTHEVPVKGGDIVGQDL